MQLLLATRNHHKTREIFRMLAGLPIDILSLSAFPGLPEVEEDEPTIEGNARKKALCCARAAGLWSLADDTALEVEALGGAPGVLSARYAGPACDYEANNRKLLAELSGLAPQARKAVFRTVMALSDPKGAVIVEEGRLEGYIAERPSGAQGFGYDPLFEVPGSGKTLAQLSPEEKNALSHRAEALRKMLPHLKRLALSAAAAVLVALLAAPSRAARTEPGQETIWDQIMASQSYRELRQGSKHLEEKRYDLAVKEFLQAVAANPKDAQARMMLGVAYYWNGEVDRSLESYRKSLELDPKNPQTYMLTGISLAWKGETQAAYEAFKKSAEIDPSRADIQMNLGSIEESLNMVPEALAHFRRAAELAPNESLYHFQLGMIYRKLGRDQEAAESFNRSIRLYGDFEDALLELGALEERRGDPKQAVIIFKRAVALKQRDAVARFRLGRLYLLAGDRNKARDVFAEAFHLTPEEGGSGLQLSVAYAGGKKEGVEGAKPAASGVPAPAPLPAMDPNDPLQVFARNLERIPLEQSAIMHVDVVFVPKPKLVKASPESPTALKNALERAFSDSEISSPKAVRRDYNIPASKPEQRERQIQQVMDDLREVMKTAPEGADVRLGMNLNFTHLAGVSRDSSRADAQDQPKVSYNPHEVGNDLGLWVMGTGWMALVEEVLPESSEAPSRPEDGDWWLAMGLGYATLGDGQRALDAFEKACRLEPANDEAFLGRAVAYVMTGNESAAVASLQDALKLNPKNRPAGEGLKWLKRPAAGPQASARRAVRQEAKP